MGYGKLCRGRIAKGARWSATRQRGRGATPLKFVVDALGLISGGGKACVHNLLPALAAQGRHEYVAMLPDLPEYAGLSSPALRVVPRPSFSHRSLLLREWLLNVTVPRLCRHEKADALLCLGNFFPHHPPVPTVAFLQNAYYVYRDTSACKGLTFRQRLRVKYGWHLFRHLAANVSVVVQTEVMKQRLLTQCAISPSRVHVILDRGVSLLTFRASSVDCREGTSSPFTFLCVSVDSPNKNLAVLVEAVKRLRTLTQRPFRCLLTIHRERYPGTRKLLATIQRERVGDVLVNMGTLPPERLAALYGSADAFILPTLLESFGRPYYEAMQFDLPILTSDRDFAHGRCQDAAVYFDPLDADSVARSMAQVIEDPALRVRLVENAKRLRGQEPTWNEIAGRFVDVLERAARGQLTGADESN